MDGYGYMQDWCSLMVDGDPPHQRSSVLTKPKPVAVTESAWVGCIMDRTTGDRTQATGHRTTDHSFLSKQLWMI